MYTCNHLYVGLSPFVYSQLLRHEIYYPIEAFIVASSNQQSFIQAYISTFNGNKILYMYDFATSFTT